MKKYAVNARFPDSFVWVRWDNSEKDNEEQNLKNIEFQIMNHESRSEKIKLSGSSPSIFFIPCSILVMAFKEPFVAKHPEIAHLR